MSVEVIEGEIPQVQPLPHDDAGVFGELGSHLAVSHVDGEDALGAPVENHLGESPGRRPGIEHQRWHRDVQIVKTTQEFVRPSGDPRLLLGSDGGVCVHRGRRLGDDGSRHPDLALLDEPGGKGA